MDFTLPGWLSRPVPSTWEFVTSEGGEFDATIFAAGKGSFYIKDSAGDGIVHELLYVGLGLTTSKGVTGAIGGSFSTADMFSEGVGNIGMRPGKSSLTASDFSGSGLILSFAIGPGVALGNARSIILFGIPPFTVASGRMRSKQYMPPGVGFTAMPCIFTLDP